MAILTPPSDPFAQHLRRLRRLACHKRRITELAQWLETQGLLTPRLAQLRSCRSWMLFRHYPELNLFHLQQTLSCNLPLLCPLCAIRRAARASYAYQLRVEDLLARHPDLTLSYAVLTIQNQADLAERFDHLQRQARILIARRRAALSALRGHSQFAYASQSCFAPVLAGAYSFEVKRGSGSHLWHPHLNLLLLSHRPIHPQHLSDEWYSLTQDSYITYCQPRQPDPSTFVEIFKYALKFSDLSYPDNYHVYQLLSHRKLLGCFGAFRGIKIPPRDTLIDASYHDLFYRYLNGEYFSL